MDKGFVCCRARTLETLQKLTMDATGTLAYAACGSDPIVSGFVEVVVSSRSDHLTGILQEMHWEELVSITS